MEWAGILTGLLSSLLAAELYMWLPHLAEKLIQYHARRVPPDLSSRLLEEWRGDLADLPGNLTKFWFALDLFRATPQISREFYASIVPLRSFTDLTLRARDILSAGTTLLLFAPLWALAAMAIRLEDNGPVFHAEGRIGRGGRTFRMWRFRAVHSEHSDRRATGVGLLLRATALEQLPQLWNVFRGDMSLVGPRALRLTDTEPDGEKGGLRRDAASEYLKRHAVRPGLTGLAQIYALSKLPRQRQNQYDLLYIHRRSFWLDLRLLAATVWIGLRRRRNSSYHPREDSFLE